MKKLYFLLLALFVISLSACSNQQQVNKNSTNEKKETEISSNNNIVNKTNIDETNTGETNSKNQIPIEKEKSIENKKTEKLPKDKQQEKEIEDNLKQEKIKELKELKKEYSEKLTKLENLWTDKKAKLQILANANCLWVCNLDMKNKLSKEELKIAQDCNKVCIAKQNKAKKELEKLEEQLKKEKQAYPEKCFQDAKKRYEQQEKNFSKEKQQLPKWFKQASKEEIIQSDAERCILIYGWTNYDCEKIKKYKKPYEKCKRLKQVEQDLQFIESWKYKSFDEYLQNNF